MTRKAAVVDTEPAFVGSLATPHDDSTDPIETQEQTAHPDVRTTYLVVAPCIIIRGERQSVGTFYDGQTVTSWQCGDGNDSATPAELDRLVALGLIKVT